MGRAWGLHVNRNATPQEKWGMPERSTHRAFRNKLTLVGRSPTIPHIVRRVFDIKMPLLMTTA